MKFYNFCCKRQRWYSMYIRADGMRLLHARTDWKPIHYVTCGSEITLSTKEQNLAHKWILWKWRNSGPKRLIRKQKPNPVVIQVKWLYMAKWLGFRFWNRGFWAQISSFLYTYHNPQRCWESKMHTLHQMCQLWRQRNNRIGRPR